MRHISRFESREYTGSLYELDALGKCEIEPEKFNLLLEVFESWGDLTNENRRLFPKHQLIKFIMEHYIEGAAEEPKQPLARDLYYLLADMLKLEDSNRLKYFSALHTPLDNMGYDAFFILDDDEKIFAGIDVTLKDEHQKRENFMSDRIILYGDMLQQEEESDEAYERRLLPHAERIKNVLLEKRKKIKGETYVRQAV